MPPRNIHAGEYAGPDRRDGQWHVKKEVNIGHMLTTLTILVTALWYAFQLDKRVTVLETQQHAQAEVITKMGHRIEGQLRDLNSKLDRIIERELRNNHAAR